MKERKTDARIGPAMKTMKPISQGERNRYTPKSASCLPACPIDRSVYAPTRECIPRVGGLREAKAGPGFRRVDRGRRIFQSPNFGIHLPCVPIQDLLRGGVSETRLVDRVVLFVPKNLSDRRHRTKLGNGEQVESGEDALFERWPQIGVGEESLD